jgi:hypothetical protein
MLVSFLIELTWYSPELRLVVFKSEILKVLTTVIFLNLMLLVITSWMWQLGKHITEEVKGKEKSIAKERAQYDQYI